MITTLRQRTTTDRPAERGRRASTERRRREILSAALGCFLKSGVRDTTMEQIRTAAGASTGSIYHLFASKDEIACTLFVEGMRDYHQRVLKAVEGKRSARGLITAIIATHLQTTVEAPELAVYLTQMSIAADLGEITGEYRAASDAFSRDLYESLRPFIESGELATHPQEWYFSLIIGPAAHLCRSWLQGRFAKGLLTATNGLAEAALKSLQP